MGLRQVLGAVRGRDPADLDAHADPDPDAHPGTCKTAWSSTAVYTQGNEVSYGNHNWVAKWWTQNEVPGASQWGPWQDEGSC